VIATDSPISPSRSRSASDAAASQPPSRYITSNCGAGRSAPAARTPEAGKARGELSEADEAKLVHGLVEIPRLMSAALATEPQIEDLKYILKRGVGVNIYMFHGGTSFGYYAGSTGGKSFLPDVTSYDYDAPLDEAGHPTEKYFAYRKVLATFNTAPIPSKF